MKGKSSTETEVFFTSKRFFEINFGKMSLKKTKLPEYRDCRFIVSLLRITAASLLASLAITSPFPSKKQENLSRERNN